MGSALWGWWSISIVRHWQQGRIIFAPSVSMGIIPVLMEDAGRPILCVGCSIPKTGLAPTAIWDMKYHKTGAASYQ